MLHRPERIFSLLNPALPSAGLYQAMPGLPQRGPLRRSPAVLRLVPAASHETFKLVRLPAALRLISAHLLTDWRLRWPTLPNVRIVRGSVDNRRGNYCFFLMFLPEVFRVGVTSNGQEELKDWKRDAPFADSPSNSRDGEQKVSSCSRKWKCCS